MTKPLLVFGWGNTSRGDDALGPLFVERLREELRARDDIDFLDDYQLMPEHALDLAGRARVLFVDASASCAAPFEVQAVARAADASFSSHALSPQALLQAYREVHGAEPPPATLLAIRGQRFTLGTPMSNCALANLDAALTWAARWLPQPALDTTT